MSEQEFVGRLVGTFVARHPLGGRQVLHHGEAVYMEPGKVTLKWYGLERHEYVGASGRSLPTPACSPRSEVHAPLGSLAPAGDSRAIASSAGGPGR